MSTRVMTWVFTESPSTGNDRLVLLAIADEADDDGTNAYPSIDRIAKKARVNKRTTMRCLERLESDGQLIVHRPEQRGRGHFNTYVVVMTDREKGDISSPDEKARIGDTEDPEKARKGAPMSALDPLTLGAKAPDPVVGAKRPTAIACPDPFTLTRDMREWAAIHSPAVDARAETEQFVDHHRAKGSTFKDWQAAWRTWMRNAQKWNGNGAVRNGSRPGRGTIEAANEDMRKRHEMIQRLAHQRMGGS